MSRRPIVLVLALAALLPALVPTGSGVGNRLGPDPQSDFDWEPSAPLALDLVTFRSTAWSGMPILLREWTIQTADGTRSAEGESAQVVFGKPGHYVVTLHVTDAALRTASTSRVVSVAHSPPHANFTMSDEFVWRGSAVVFEDASHDVDGDVIVERVWDLGDGTTARGERVEHAYSQLGRFDVTLTVRDAAGGVSSVARAIRVLNQPPSVAADHSPRAPLVDEPVTFTASGVDPDLAGGAITYSWAFSDGFAAESDTVTRSFPHAGNYSASVRGLDSEGAYSAPVMLVVQVFAPAPDAGFAFSPSIPLRGEPVRFEAANGSATSWRWSFGDGTASVERAPTHVFATHGTFLVTLEVRDAQGLANATKREVLVNLAPTARLLAPATAAIGAPIAFEDASSDDDGVVVSWQWEFGDGATSTQRHPTHTYAAPGEHRVVLTVRDEHGAAASVSRLVQVENALPVAAWTHTTDGLPLERGVRVHFDGASLSYDADGHPLSYAWSFGDGAVAAGGLVEHAFAHSGVHTVGLVVDDGFGPSARTSESHKPLRVLPAHDVVLHIHAHRPDGTQPSLAYDDAYRTRVFLADGAIVSDHGSPDGNGLAITVPRAGWGHGEAVRVRVDSPHLVEPAEAWVTLHDDVADVIVRLSLPLELTAHVEAESARGLAEPAGGGGRIAWRDGEGVENATVTLFLRYAPLRPLVDAPAPAWCEAATALTGVGGAFTWSADPGLTCGGIPHATPGTWEVRAVATAYGRVAESATASYGVGLDAAPA